MRAISVAVAILLAASSTAQSQVPTVAGKWDTNGAQVFIHADLPPSCDASTIRAKDTWNAQGARFIYGWSTANYQTEYQAFNGRVTLAPQGDLPTSVPARMTPYGSPRTSAWIGINDGMLFWNPNGYYDEGQFSCPTSRSGTPTNLYSYEYVAAHELGHAFGFGHHQVNDYNCLMTTGTYEGDPRTQPCPTERTEFQRLYGVR